MAIRTDGVYEGDETFHVELTRPLGSDKYLALLGEVTSTTVTITNMNDGEIIMMYTCYLGLKKISCVSGNPTLPIGTGRP